ncbi:MAG: hypothetical protein CMP23_08555 [Rickettsiales bacterium]|nr:hypothetical protein [Rickettsiales bacterium]
MTHQAIARKWRPRRFEEISGQTHVTRTLQNAIRLGKVHHAFLLTGARGVGKTSAARILARALNCEQGPAENPCNECSACTEMLAGSYPDLVEIDAASHNSVDNIRDLVEKAQYTPQRGRYKVYIIDEVHMVTKQGFNALLKTLEEPPPHVIFILATTDPQQLLDTVISRCQRFDFKMIPVRTVFERLKFVAEQEGVAVPEASLKVIAREGGGSMRDAQSLLDQVLSFSGESVTEQEVAEILGFIDRSILYGILDSTLSEDPAGALTALARVADYGYDVRTFAGQLLEAVRNVALVVQVSKAAELLDLPDDEIRRLEALAKDRDPALLSQQFDILAATVDSIARSEQPMLLLEMATVKMASVRPLVPVAALLARLEALERRLRRSGAAGGGGGGSARGSQPRPASHSSSSSGYRSAPDEQNNRAQTTSPAAEAASAAQNDAEPNSQELTRLAEPVAPASAHEGTAWPQASESPAPTTEPSTPPSQADLARVTTPAPAPAVPAADDVLDSLFSYRRGSATRTEPSQPPSDPGPIRRQQGSAKLTPPEAKPEPSEATDPASNNEQESATLPPQLRASAPVKQAEEALQPCDGRAWRRFVHELRGDERLAPLAALLATSGLISCEGQSIRLGFDSEPTLQQAERLATDESFRREAKAHFGEDLNFVFVLDQTGTRARSLAEELSRIRADHREAREAEARQHPVITASMETFPGAIIDNVKVVPLKEIPHVN